MRLTAVGGSQHLAKPEVLSKLRPHHIEKLRQQGNKLTYSAENFRDVSLGIGQNCEIKTFMSWTELEEKRAVITGISDNMTTKNE